MTKNHDLKVRVNIQKHELEIERTKLNEISGNITEFVSNIKSRSTIYNLIKNLPMWRKLEEWIDSDDETEE